MSDQTMIERMGRAIFSYDVHYRSRGGDVWETAPSDHRDRCLKQARLVLTAMREPTESMEKADTDFGNISGYLDGFDAKMVWRAMIDAALEDEG